MVKSHIFLLLFFGVPDALGVFFFLGGGGVTCWSSYALGITLDAWA